MLPSAPASLRARAEDPLYPVSGQLPLGRRLVAAPDDPAPSTPAGALPFGLRFAAVPEHAISVDLTGLRYDPQRQMCVDANGIPNYGKHSTGQTATRTSDGHKSMDSDTDYTED